jgi:hypothetical protein
MVMVDHPAKYFKPIIQNKSKVKSKNVSLIAPHSTPEYVDGNWTLAACRDKLKVL